MKAADFDKFVDEFTEMMNDTLVSKGHDYTFNEDRLSNYKVIAPLIGMTPLQCWGVYFLKHVSAVLTYIKTGVVKSESIEGRFLDIANYAILGAALVREGDAPVEVPAALAGQPQNVEAVNLLRRIFEEVKAGKVKGETMKLLEEAVSPPAVADNGVDVAA